MIKIAIVVALQSELECTERLFSDIEEICCDNVTYYFGECNGHQIIVSQSGIGKVCAATRCHDIITNFEPDCIINTGLAGGIDIGSVSGGLYVKMIASASGLTIGILAYIGYHILNMMVERLILKMETEAVEFIDLLDEPGV